MVGFAKCLRWLCPRLKATLTLTAAPISHAHSYTTLGLASQGRGPSKHEGKVQQMHGEAFIVWLCLELDLV